MCLYILRGWSNVVYGSFGGGLGCFGGGLGWFGGGLGWFWVF